MGPGPVVLLTMNNQRGAKVPLLTIKLFRSLGWARKWFVHELSRGPEGLRRCYLLEKERLKCSSLTA